jgi:hypothetical protein
VSFIWAKDGGRMFHRNASIYLRHMASQCRGQPGQFVFFVYLTSLCQVLRLIKVSIETLLVSLLKINDKF